MVKQILKNQTTNEDLKKVYQNVPNLHDQGWRHNLRTFLCAPRVKSAVAQVRNAAYLVGAC